MSKLSALKMDDNIQTETDSVGSFGPLDTNIYDVSVAMAYLGKSKGGAMSLTLHLKTAEGREVRQTLWVTSGDAKGNLPYYTDSEGAKKYLPGFNVANSLCLLTVSKELGDLDPEDKMVNIYSFDEKKEVPTEVPVLMDLIDQEIKVGLLKQIVDKNVKDGNGEYVPSGDTREENEIDKFFRSRDNMTTAEIRAGAEEAGFHDRWLARWEGQVRDRSTKDVAKPAAANDSKPEKSLFK